MFKNRKHSNESNIKRSKTLKKLYKNNKLMGFGKGNGYKTPKGNIPWNKNKKGVQVAWNKGIPNKNLSGKNSKWWKGGITPIHTKIRHSIEYKLWRESVFKRDNYTCIWCKQIGGILHADHIKPFALFPELRFAIDNGRTLCINCHKLTDTYGWKINKKI